MASFLPPPILPRFRPSTLTMSTRHIRRPENTPGPLYVDATCIDCDTCRWLSPQFFNRQNGQSAVYTQPHSDQDRRAALEAVIACPTGSINLQDSTKEERKIARDSFPMPVQGYNGIYYLYPSKDTFGGSAYLTMRKEGAVMFDVPRWNEGLAKKIEGITKECGGVKWMVLSHCDDVAGHEKWAKRLGCQRVIHVEDVRQWQGTTECEVKLGDEDVSFEKGGWKVGEGLRVFGVRGHTRGSVCLLDEKEMVLFTGDHCYGRMNGKLGAGWRYMRDSWDWQIRNVENLKRLKFTAVLPGHGRPTFWQNMDEKNEAVEQAVHDMKSDSPVRV